MPESNVNRILDQIEDVENLPSIPAVAVEVIRLTRSPDGSIQAIAEMISKDPALSTKVLRAVNSGLFNLRSDICSLEHAATLLGTLRLSTLALSFSLIRNTKWDTDGFDYTLFWQRSLFAAVAAQRIFESVSSGPADEIFTCALTQDLGVLALTNLDPNYCALIQECQNDHDKLIDCEKTLYGVDHATITAHLLDAWKLPTIFSMSAMGSHDPTTVATDIDASVLTLIHCISLSGIFADVFVAEDTRKNLEKARTLGEKYFGFNADQVSALLEGIREQVPEISELFDFKLLSRAALDAIVEEARSLLVKINLRALSEMQDSVQTIERLSEENRVLKNKADIDPLTEAFNRRFLKRYLKTAFFEAMTKERNLSCVFIDVDHFKRVNDQFGHDVGDRVLQSLVKEIKEIIRNNDVVVRYGGEEFVVVLRRVEPDVALGVAWRICKSIRGMTLTAADGSDVRVGVSIGVATHTPDDRFASADSLLRAADAALYEAKSKGRDRVVRYERQ